MNIQIKGDTADENVTVSISNESFNNYNFVSISWIENSGSDNEEFREVDVPVDELYRALELFNNIRKDHIND